MADPVLKFPPEQKPAEQKGSPAAPREKIAAHFHDTYGQSLANILAVMERGIAVCGSGVGAEVCATYADNGTLQILGRPNAVYGARTSTTIPCTELAYEARGLASPALRYRHLASAAESFR